MIDDIVKDGKVLVMGCVQMSKAVQQSLNDKGVVLQQAPESVDGNSFNRFWLPVEYAKSYSLSRGNPSVANTLRFAG